MMVVRRPPPPSVEPIEPEYVDLGLPSGNLWATCNLGAETETDYGLYFQWGDTKGYKGACVESESDGNDDMHYFDWSKYKFNTQEGLTKYNNIDNKTVLDVEDDAVVVVLGGDWRMPTSEEFLELIDNTDPGDGANQYGWVTNYNGTGINGILRKSKTNGNTIFFSACGGCRENSSYSVGNGGNYWSNCLSTNDSAQPLAFYSGDFRLGNNSRIYGFPIRAVKPTE